MSWTWLSQAPGGTLRQGWEDGACRVLDGSKVRRAKEVL